MVCNALYCVSLYQKLQSYNHFLLKLVLYFLKVASCLGAMKVNTGDFMMGNQATDRKKNFFLSNVDIRLRL